MTNKKYLLIILILALLLRLPHLFDKEKGTDERLSIRNAQEFKNIENIVNYKKILTNEVNPPLFFILLGISLILFNSMITLKIMTILISLLSVFIFYIFTKEFLDEKKSIFITLLYAINPVHIIFSQHIRPYIFLFLLYNISLYFLWKFLKTGDNKSLFFIITTYLLSVYTHYYSVLFIMGSSLVVLIFYYYNKKIKIVKYIVSNVLLLILSIPSFLLLKFQYTTYFPLDQTKSIITPKIIPYPLYKLSLMIDVSTTLKNFPYLIIIPILLVILAAYGIYSLYKENKNKSLFIMLNFLIPYITLSIAGLILPIHSFRYFMFLLPLYIIPIGYSFFKIKNKYIKYLILLTIIMGWIMAILYYYNISTTYHWPEHIAI